MPRARITSPPPTDPTEPPETSGFDEISDEERAQAEAGTLFSIQGQGFEHVRWSIHRVRTREEIAADTSGQKTEWVADTTGPLDGSALLQLVGGGTFRFMGYVDNPDPTSRSRQYLGYNRTIALAGPRKDFSGRVTVTPPTENAHAETGLVALLARMDARLERLERAPAPAAPATSIKDLAETMVLLHGISAKSGPPSDAQTARELFNAMSTSLQTGIAIGQEREPKPDGEGDGVWPAVNKALEVFGELMKSRGAAVRTGPSPAAPAVAGGAAPVAPPPPAANGSHAEVLDDQINTARIMTVVDLLARGVREAEPAEDVADTIERVLPPDVLASFLVAPDQVIVADIASKSAAAYPDLATEPGKAFVTRVLTELRSPTLEAE